MIPKTVKGTRDIFGEEVEKFQKIEEVSKKILELFNFQEIRTPILEHAELFFRGVGENTDIVGKEMYLLKDRRDQDLALRPEGTASIVRSVVKNNLLRNFRRQKLFYFGPMFRFERPQKGRYRQFHQLGVETFGNSKPNAEIEQILFLNLLFEELNIKDINFKVNTIGCENSECKPAYKIKLVEELRKNTSSLCEDCQRRLETNPLRVFDCKVDACQTIYDQMPKINEHVCEPCSDHFKEFLSLMDLHTLEYTVDHKLVRGLDYYTKTVFEIHSGALGAQSAAGGGGRYDKLFEVYGEKEVPSVGFALGLDRLVLMLDELEKKETLSFVIGHEAEAVSLLVQNLRKNEIPCEYDPELSSMKSQFKQADKFDTRFALILGEDEIATGEISVKDFKSGKQVKIPNDDLVSYLKERI